MKVGLVCPYSLSWPGGVQGHVLSLSWHLRELGCDTRIIAPCDATPPAVEVSSIGGSHPFNANGSIANLSVGPRTFVRTRRVLLAEHFDLLHVHEPFQAGASVFALLHSGGVPVVGSFHAAATEMAPYRRLHALLSWLWRRIDLHAAVSPAAADLVRRYFGGEYRILPNGIEVSDFVEAKPADRDPDDFIVLFVGRLERRKGCKILLRAWQEIEETIPAARLWVVGTGPEEPSLREMVARAKCSRVEFLGSLDAAELRGRYRAADLFCSPAIEGESFGIVLLEAMAAGTPILASDLPGYRELLRDDVGKLFTPGDSESLRSELIAMWMDPRALRSFSERGRERVSEFDWKILAREVLSTYEEVISGRGCNNAA